MRFILIAIVLIVNLIAFIGLIQISPTATQFENFGPKISIFGIENSAVVELNLLKRHRRETLYGKWEW